MKFKIPNAWRRLRRRPVLSLSIDVAVIVLVFLLIHSWNTRNLRQGVLPDLKLPALSASEIPETEGVGVIYFFAPWCFYCKNSIDNVEALVTEGRLDWARAVALEYDSKGAVQAFVDETGFRQPVLLGNGGVTREWGIQAFPTYFVVDSDGRISSRSVGYSTKAGLWLRARLAE
ncbi:MAG: redoxin domain-containing protein [Xanthomonadales bacterium]|nr:redoxin domain-containing protein [Gammaproteobacteria bacterium]NNL95593.1 redoxin domain-containing protein [Xanthomonadales bacterium]